MKKLEIAAFASLVTGVVLAYPSKQEIAEAQPMVAEPIRSFVSTSQISLIGSKGFR